MSLEENKGLAEEYFPVTSTCDDGMYDDIMIEDFTVHAVHSKYAAVLNAGDEGRGPEVWDLIDRLGQWQQLGMVPPPTEFLALVLRDQRSA
jgi:hypothetical protein